MSKQEAMSSGSSEEEISSDEEMIDIKALIRAKAFIDTDDEEDSSMNNLDSDEDNDNEGGVELFLYPLSSQSPAPALTPLEKMQRLLDYYNNIPLGNESEPSSGESHSRIRPISIPRSAGRVSEDLVSGLMGDHSSASPMRLRRPEFSASPPRWASVQPMSPQAGAGDEPYPWTRTQDDVVNELLGAGFRPSQIRRRPAPSDFSTSPPMMFPTDDVVNGLLSSGYRPSSSPARRRRMPPEFSSSPPRWGNVNATSTPIRASRAAYEDDDDDDDSDSDVEMPTETSGRFILPAAIRVREMIQEPDEDKTEQANKAVFVGELLLSSIVKKD